MCQSLADGGRRCTGTSTGRALYALYKERRTHPDRSEEITARIQTLREAESLYGGRFVTPSTCPCPTVFPRPWTPFAVSETRLWWEAQLGT